MAGFFKKLFGVGTITLYSADQSHREQELKNIKKPVEVKNMLSDLIEKCREAKRISGREFMSVDDVHDDMDMDMDMDGEA